MTTTNSEHKTTTTGTNAAPAADAKKTRSTALSELEAMTKIAGILNRLPEESRKRVLGGIVEVIGG